MTSTPPQPPCSGLVDGRRRVLWEVALLLGVSLGRSAIFSVLNVVERTTRDVPLEQQTSSLNRAVTPDRPWLSALYQLADVLLLPAPALLALLLLATVNPPRQGVRACLGLDGGHLRRDLSWAVGIFVGIGIPGLGLYLGSRALGLNTTVQASALGDHWWAVPLLVASAAGNAVLEEVVMVGYLFLRGSQARIPARLVLVGSAVVRGSYHLYQGFGGFVGNLVMGLLFGSFFRRTGRLWPLVVAHFLLDVASFVGYAVLAGRVSWL